MELGYQDIFVLQKFKNIVGSLTTKYNIND